MRDEGGGMTNPAIDEILANFDFEKVHRVMVFLDWRWIGTDGWKVPSVKRLQAAAAHHLASLASLDPGASAMSGAGGLRAERQGDRYELCFVLTNWDSWGAE